MLTFFSSDLYPLNGQRMTIHRLAPLDQTKSRTMAAFKRDLYSGNAQRVNAGAGVVVARI